MGLRVGGGSKDSERNSDGSGASLTRETVPSKSTCGAGRGGLGRVPDSGGLANGSDHGHNGTGR